MAVSWAKPVMQSNPLACYQGNAKSVPLSGLKEVFK